MVEFKKRYIGDPRANGKGPDGKRLDAKKAFKSAFRIVENVNLLILD